MKRHLLMAIYLIASTTMLLAQDIPDVRPLTYWFDTPTSLKGKTIWYDGIHDLNKQNTKPISAGDTACNPDAEWESQSIPLGNGSLGANILGSIYTERITFNEKTLWRGGPNTAAGPTAYWQINKHSAHWLDDIRKAFESGDWTTAEKLTCENFNSEVPYESWAEEPFRFGNFTTMGEFYIETGINEADICNYRRSLSLDSALATVQFQKENINYQRSYFISYPHNVLVMRFRANTPKMQNLIFSYEPNPVSEGKMSADSKNGLIFNAVLDNNHMAYSIRIRTIHQGGKLENDGNSLRITGADEVIFLVTADTDYQINYNPNYSDPLTYVGVHPQKTTLDWIKQAETLGYERLFETHYCDYQHLFGRVQINLNPDEPYSDMPITQRLYKYREGKRDSFLEELYYQFGRYLLIASSRSGNLPANLQGIWHNNVDGPWRVDYHNNINLQMNYWPACSTNLSECMLPLVDFVRMLVKPGKETAQAYFGARGWTTSISGNIFGFTTPLSSKDMTWNFCPLAGPWLATCIWDYYDYTRDYTFLKNIGYELIKGGARFAVDYLWKKNDGTYTAAPSTSPEHGPIDEGTTFAHAVIREILLDAIEASRILKTDYKERKEWERVLLNLSPYRIGRYGQLMEWSKDIDDPNDKHRHVNHLFGVHPGHTISPVTTPELAKASQIVLEHRGDGATGWSMGWKLNLWARLHNGNRAYNLFRNLLKTGTLDNLWDTHPPFQIDGNLGGTAGITEMFLQSQMDFIHLLPALPDAWEQGEITGLCARGNFEISIEWENKYLKKVQLLSKSGEVCILRYKNQELKFKTCQGKTYLIEWSDGKLKMR